MPNEELERRAEEAAQSIDTLRRAYEEDALPALQFGYAAIRLQKTSGESMAAIARGLGIDPAQLSQYVGLTSRLAPSLRVELEAGTLSFRVARAAMRIKPDERQHEFVEAVRKVQDKGGLPAYRLVDGLATLVGRHPTTPVSDLLGEMVQEAKEGRAARDEARNPSPVEREAMVVRAKKLALDLAGVLDHLRVFPPSQPDMMDLEKVLKSVLEPRMPGAEGRKMPAGLRPRVIPTGAARDS
ncbi:MAG: hypothetical protein Q8R28_02155 [Dehalococcoidia bacterium]|nr:hypothetical protein [Dehalococcoidia bacterium]